MLARGVDALGAHRLERRADDVGVVVVLGLHDHDAAPVAQRLLVDEQLVARHAGREPVLELVTDRRAARGEERPAEQPGGDDGADAGEHERRDRRADRDADRCARRPARDRAERRAHPRLFAFVRRHACDHLPVRHPRREHVDGVVAHADPAQPLDRARRIFT
ncbi:MAG: hypothetical protein FJZ38_23395 [Candidatus Rokubacteria bacterium]|nr:hypothetical protein [Candidatus Rokubacteria bacterium]